MKAMEWTETFSPTETKQKILVKESSTRRMYDFSIPKALPISINHPLLSWRHFFEGSTPDDPEHPDVVEEWLASEKCYVFVQFPWLMRRKTKVAYFAKWAALGYQAQCLGDSNGRSACWLITKPGCLADDFMPYEEFVTLMEVIETEWGEWLFRGYDRDCCQAHWSMDYTTLCWQRFVLNEEASKGCHFLDALIQRLPLVTVIGQQDSSFSDLNYELLRTCQRQMKRGAWILPYLVAATQGLAYYALQSFIPGWSLLIALGLIGLLLLVAIERFFASTAQIIQLLLLESLSVSVGVIWMVVVALTAG